MAGRGGRLQEAARDVRGDGEQKETSSHFLRNRIYFNASYKIDLASLLGGRRNTHYFNFIAASN